MTIITRPPPQKKKKKKKKNHKLVTHCHWHNGIHSNIESSSTINQIHYSADEIVTGSVWAARALMNPKLWWINGLSSVICVKGPDRSTWQPSWIINPVVIIIKYFGVYLVNHFVENWKCICIVNWIGSGNVLLPDGTKPLPETILTSH